MLKHTEAIECVDSIYVIVRNGEWLLSALSAGRRTEHDDMSGAEVLQRVAGHVRHVQMVHVHAELALPALAHDAVIALELRIAKQEDPRHRALSRVRSSAEEGIVCNVECDARERDGEGDEDAGCGQAGPRSAVGTVSDVEKSVR